MLAGFLTVPYIVRGLGANAYGILSIAWMVLGYFSIFDLGLSRATVKFVAESLKSEDTTRVPELVWTSLTMLIAFGTAGGLAVAAAVPFVVTRFLTLPPAFVSEAELSLLVLSLSMPIMLGNDALRGVLEATQRFDLVNLVKAPASVCFYLLAAVAIPFHIRVSGIVALLALVRLTSACAYLALCLKVLPGLRLHVSVSLKALRPLASYGGWVMVSNVTGPILSSIERLLIGSVLSVAMLTYYSVPLDLVGKLLIFPASIAPALFPYFSQRGSKRRSEVSEVSSQALKYMFVTMSPLVVLFVCFARDILTLWMGPEFAAHSTTVLQLTAITILINAFGYVPYSSVQALGRPDLKAKLDLLMVFVYAASAWWLMHLLGLTGAALAKLLITAADTSCLLAFARHMKAFSAKACISAVGARMPLVAGALLLGGVAIHRMQAGTVASSGLFALLCLFYAVAVWYWVMDGNERLVMARAVWYSPSKQDGAVVAR